MNGFDSVTCAKNDISLLKEHFKLIGLDTIEEIQFYRQPLVDQGQGDLWLELERTFKDAKEKYEEELKCSRVL